MTKELEPKFVKELGAWICPICRETFRTRGEAIEHIKAVHLETPSEEGGPKAEGDIKERHRGAFQLEFEHGETRFKLTLSNIDPESAAELSAQLFEELLKKVRREA